MQKRKLGTAVIWMICLLGLVAVVWSRPPLAGSRSVSHPPLAMAAEDVSQPLPSQASLEPLTEAETQPVPFNLVPLPQVPLPQSPALPDLVFVRDFQPYKLTFRFEGNRLLASFQGTVEDGKQVECRIAADYHLTKDSVLYGVITSAELVGSPVDPEERLEADRLIHQLFDQPFALRYRLDEGMLTVKDFKIAPIQEPSEFAQVLMPFILGTYRPASSPPPSL